MKYMKVISALVLFSRWPTCLWNTWKWFQHWFLWNTWKWFQHWSYFPGDQPVCEIHESDFSIGLIFQVTNPFVKYMKMISALVLWNTWKWFQHWSYFPGDQPVCEIHESDFYIDFCELHESDFTMSFSVDENF
jgi:hypothetical protein